MVPLSWPTYLLSDTGCQFVGVGGVTLLSALAPSAGDKAAKSDIVCRSHGNWSIFAGSGELCG